MTSKKSSWTGVWLLSALAVVVVSGACAGRQASAESLEFTDVQKHTREFMAYDASIELTPEQHEIFRQALEPMPAPCCSDNSAYTCCCPCNLAKTWWGLAKHLIVDRGFDAEQVREGVQEWFDFINSDGFSGQVCTTGGCNRSFEKDGCGGMSEHYVVF